MLGSAAGCLYLGVQYELRALTGLGLALLGAGLALNGVDDVLRKEVNETQAERSVTFTYCGWSAIALGAFWCAGGAALFTAGLALLAGRWPAWWARLQARPGPLFLLGGFEALAMGLHSLLGSRQERANLGGLLASLPQRLFGLLLMLGGFLALCAGLLEILAPQVFQNLAGNLF